MRNIIFLSALAFAVLPLSWATSKLPPDIPIMLLDEKIVFSFKEIFDQTNDGEITNIAVCRQLGSLCVEEVWVVQFPQGWRAQEITMFQTHPQTVQLKRNPSALHAGGNYALYVDFHERGRRKKQTVNNTITEFCLIQDEARLALQSPHECAVRRVREDKSRDK